MDKVQELKIAARDARHEADQLALIDTSVGLKERLKTQSERLEKARAAQARAEKLEAAVELAREEANTLFEEYVEVIPDTVEEHDEQDDEQDAVENQFGTYTVPESEEARVKEFSDLVGITAPTVLLVLGCLVVTAAQS